MTTTNMDSIIIFNELNIIRQRISNILQDYSIQIYKASYDVELYNLLSNSKLNFSLVIMDVGHDVNKGYEILSKINAKKSDIPVLVLTSNNKREVFLTGISKGASDFLLKPFDDDHLLEKILSALHKKRKDPVLQIDSKSEIVFDIQSYLTTELSKAEKGKYEITVLMSTILAATEENDSKAENRFRLISDLFYKKFKSISWATDLFERNGLLSFIGAFPYSGLNNLDKIQKKLLDCFDSVKKTNDELSKFHLAISTIVYPSEATDPDQLLTVLGKRMQKVIEEGIQPDSDMESNPDTGKESKPDIEKESQSGNGKESKPGIGKESQSGIGKISNNDTKKPAVTNQYRSRR